jgi:hypothetical protein
MTSTNMQPANIYAHNRVVSSKSHPRRTGVALLMAAFCATTAHCYLDVERDDAGGTSTAPTKSPSSVSSQSGAIECDPNAKPPVDVLRRLTTAQYRATVDAFVVSLLNDPNAPATIKDLPSLKNLPADEREKTIEDKHGSYRRLDQTLQAARTESVYLAGVDIGVAVTRGANLEKAVGKCATDSNPANDSACIDGFIRKIAPQLLRRPATDADVTFYRKVYGASTDQDRDAYADIIGVMLNAPEFLYFVEHGDKLVASPPPVAASAAPVGPIASIYMLGPYELASRLSYQLWDGPPDAALLAAASNGSLLSEDGYKAQVDRMFADPRTNKTMREFFRDWVKVEDLPGLDLRNSDALFRNFAGENLPTPRLRNEMVDDVLSTIDYLTWNKGATMRDLFTTQVSVNRGAELAKIYGVPVWNGAGEPPTFGETRPGLFTRALFLATGSATTRPIMKGVFLRGAVLCDTLGTPPASVKLAPPDLRSDMTTREVVEELTEKPGTECSGCHVGALNGLGFATEGFDSLGRVRTKQKLFDENGMFVTEKPVRTDAVPFVDFDDSSKVTGANELMSQLAKSKKPAACFARNYFRFTYGRWETKGDMCMIKRNAEVLEKGNIRDILRALVMDPSFKQRVFD